MPDEALLERIADDYVESWPLYYDFVPHQRIPPFRVHWHVPRMLSDETVQIGLWAVKGHMLSMAKIFVDTSPMGDEDQYIKTFLINQLDKWWLHSVIQQMTCIEYGYSGAEVIYDINQDGLLVFDSLRPFLSRDIAAVIYRNEQVGMVYRSRANPAPRYIGGRKKLWSVQQKEINKYYGRSRLYGSYKSWSKKAMDRGAEDQALHYFYRYGYGGDIVRFPPGVGISKDGQKIDNKLVAVDMGEKMASGSTVFLPNTFDPANGQQLWDITTREIPGTADNVLQWMDHLDEKILRGMGVTREILEEPSTGSLAGRRVAESAFHGMLTQIFMDLVMDFDIQVLRPLVAGNFGVKPSYNLQPLGLIQRFDLNQTFGAMSGQDMDPESVDSDPLKKPKDNGARADGQKENV